VRKGHIPHGREECSGLMTEKMGGGGGRPVWGKKKRGEKKFSFVVSRSERLFGKMFDLCSPGIGGCRVLRSRKGPQPKRGQTDRTRQGLQTHLWL